MVLQRLKQTAAKETSDGYRLTAVKLKGDINTDGIKFTLPTVVPEKPLMLLQQRIANCNDREVLGRSTVNKSTENSETFSKSTTLGGETSVTVSYESPIGLGASASQSFNYSKTETQEKTYTETVGWDRTTSSRKEIRRFKDEKWESGKGNLNDEVTAIGISGNAKVTVYEHHDLGGLVP